MVNPETAIRITGFSGKVKKMQAVTAVRVFCSFPLADLDTKPPHAPDPHNHAHGSRHGAPHGPRHGAPHDQAHDQAHGVPRGWGGDKNKKWGGTGSLSHTTPSRGHMLHASSVQASPTYPSHISLLHIPPTCPLTCPPTCPRRPALSAAAPETPDLQTQLAAHRLVALNVPENSSGSARPGLHRLQAHAVHGS